MIARRALGVIVVIVLAAPGQALPAEDVGFVAPSIAGPVAPGETVAYRLEGACADVQVSVSNGEAVTGCSGTVTVPDEATTMTLTATRGDVVVAELPLRNKRIEFEDAIVVAGDATVVSAADDPFGGGSALKVAAPGTTLSLGIVDLRSISSMSLRAAAEPVSCHPSYEDGFATYCRAGEVLITGGSPDGPVLTVVEIPGSDDARPWKRTLSEPVRVHPPGPVELFASVVGAGVRLNYLELNGSGIAEPHVFDADPAGTMVLLDESAGSFEAWEMVGTGSFQREADGSIRSVGGYGLLWYPVAELSDGRLRLEFKVDGPDANSGVFVRFADPEGSALAPSGTGYEVQIQDYGQAYFGSSDTSQTGAIYALRAAERINTRSVGEWNTLEVVMVRHSYSVELNGRVVTEFTGSKRLSGYVGVQNHDPSGTVWYRTIRFIPSP